MNELQAAPQQALNTSTMLFDQNIMQQMHLIATTMSTSKVTVPKHFQGSQGDCLAMVMQAAQWNMNPFAVAQKTHLVNGVLGYEAQLVNAVIQQSGAIKGRFHYEYMGEIDNLQCRVGAIINGEDEITWGEWLRNGDVTTRNSPLWKTNPKQQLGYLQVKNWARLYCPGAILGVYTIDEAEEMASSTVIPPKDTDINGKLVNEVTADVLNGLNKKPTKTEPVNEPVPTVTLDEVLAAIASMTDKDSRQKVQLMMTELSKDDQTQAGAAYRARIAELKAQSEAQTQPAQDPHADWLAAIDSCSNLDELDTLESNMADDAYQALSKERESKRQTLTPANDPFAME